MFKTLRSWFSGNATSDRIGEQIKTPDRYITESAKPVTEDSALQISAVWACVRLLVETIGSVPMKVYQYDDETKTKRYVKDLDIAKIICSQPNSRMTAQELRETLALNLILHGNAYCIIDRNSRGNVIALQPMPTEQVRVDVELDGSLTYTYQHDKGVNVFAEQSVMHIKLFGNGSIGLSPLAYARNTIGLASATEDYNHKYFINGAKPSGVLTIDKLLTPEQRAGIQERYKGLLQGNENSHRLAILEMGMQYQQVQINPDDMQLIETRRFQIEDIARFFGVPSFLINDTEKTTTWGSGIEQMMIGFYTLNLNPYFTRFENAFTRKLLTPSQRDKYVIEFDTSDLLRADARSRAEITAIQIEKGVKTRNEARQELGLAPLPGGDNLTAQINHAPLNELGDRNNAESQ